MNKNHNPATLTEHNIDPMAIISAITDGLIIFGQGKILYANPAFLAMVGLQFSDISDRSFAKVIYKEHREKVMDYLNNPLIHQDDQKGIEFRFQNVKEKFFSLKVSTIQCHDMQATLAYVSDITERRKERLRIKRLHARLRSILDHMRELVLSFSYLEDFEKNAIKDFSFFDDHLMEVNSSALAFYEIPAPYILNKKISVFDFIHEYDQDKVLTHYIDLFAKGTSEISYRIVTASGKIKWVLDYGRVEYMKTGRVRRVNHIIEDITEKKEALDKISASEKKYRRIFELSKDMIYILKPDGQFIDINPAGIKLLGLKNKEEAFRRNITEFHVDLKARNALVKEIIEKGDVTRPRMLFKNVKGEKFEVGLNIIAQKDDNGKVISYQGIVHNITEAIRQKELEAISQLAGCFADDLASPLSVILIGVETSKTFISDIQKLVEKVTNADNTTDVKEIIYEIQFNVSDVNYFLNEVMVAVEDIKQRLKEIRDQYWNLKKVPDGSGGIIYQRGNKDL